MISEESRRGAPSVNVSKCCPPKEPTSTFAPDDMAIKENVQSFRCCRVDERTLELRNIIFSTDSTRLDSLDSLGQPETLTLTILQIAIVACNPEATSVEKLKVQPHPATNVQRPRFHSHYFLHILFVVQEQ